jgi:poly-beta-1,6-N-acetyl-D-glucosamine synthase
MNIESILEILFWFLIFIPIHSYIFYPLIIWAISIFFKRKKTQENINLPNISIVISAFNEEKVIQNRVENISNQNYDFNKLELIIGSDCSTDKTNELLLALKKKYSWLKVILFNERRGKATVINDLVNHSNGSILLFSDANTEFEKNAVYNLVSEFSDPNIGGVSGKLELVEPVQNFEKSSQEIMYWDFEVLIKKLEGKIGILIGANGGIFAIRKDLFKSIPIDKAVTDDLFITLAVLKQQYKFNYTFNAKAKEDTAKDLTTEFNRKVRFASTNFETLSYFKELLHSKNLLLSFALWSHKVFRWITPFLLIIIFVLNTVLVSTGSIYKYTFYFQIIIYIMALSGFLASLFKLRVPVITTIFYFIYSNLAIIIGFYRYITGSHSGIWNPTSR